MALRRFLDDGMAERAASLAFYGLLSLIPVLLISATAIRLFGDAGSASDAQSSAREAGASSSVSAALRGMVQTARSSTATGAGSAGLVGLVTLLYGASKVFTDAGRALDQIHGEGPVKRPLGKRLRTSAGPWCSSSAGCSSCSSSPSPAPSCARWRSSWGWATSRRGGGTSPGGR